MLLVAVGFPLSILVPKDTLLVQWQCKSTLSRAKTSHVALICNSITILSTHGPNGAKD